MYIYLYKINYENPNQKFKMCMLVWAINNSCLLLLAQKPVKGKKSIEEYQKINRLFISLEGGAVKSRSAMCSCTFSSNELNWGLELNATLHRLVGTFTVHIWAVLTEKCFRTLRKMCRFRLSCACAKYHPALCSPFINSVVSNDSIRGQWRPWCTGWFGPSLSAYAQRQVFAWPSPCMPCFFPPQSMPHLGTLIKGF